MNSQESELIDKVCDLITENSPEDVLGALFDLARYVSEGDDSQDKRTKQHAAIIHQSLEMLLVRLDDFNSVH
jgi:hypothetical protein